MLKNPVDIPEYVLFSEELYLTAGDSAPTPMREVSPELEGFGTVRAYFVAVGDLETAPDPVVAPSLTKRIGQTFAAVGPGLPYMLGMRGTGRAASAQ